MKSRGGFAMMAAGLGCALHRCGSSGFPSVTPHTAFRGKMGTWLWIIIEVFAKLEIHSSLIFFLSRQLSKFFRPLLLLISVQTPISYPLSVYCRSPSAVSFSWCFCFSSRVPKTFFQSEHEITVRTAIIAIFTSQLFNSEFLTNFTY